MSNKIDQNTVIPIALVITIIGAVFNLGVTHSRVTTSENEINELKNKLTVLEKINTRLSRIEGALGVKKTDED